MTPTTKKKRQRSPNSPYLDLEQAVVKVRTLFDADRRHAMPAALAHERWDYKAESSAAQQCEAALKAYGLLDAQGSGKSRKLSVSEAAERILRDAPDREQLIRQAALGPKIHAELWNKYAGDGLPSDDIIRTYLLWERETGRFNEEAVGDVIRRFRSTIALAKLVQGDIIEDGDHSNLDPPGDGGKPSQEGILTPPQAGCFPLPVLMDDGSFQVVSIPQMSEAAFKLFKEHLEAYKNGFVRPKDPENRGDE